MQAFMRARHESPGQVSSLRQICHSLWNRCLAWLAPLKAQLTLSTHEPQLVRPRGALQAHVRFEPQADMSNELWLSLTNLDGVLN